MARFQSTGNLTDKRNSLTIIVRGLTSKGVKVLRKNSGMLSGYYI